MQFRLSAAGLALWNFALVTSIPVAPQQALLDLQRTEAIVTQLQADIVQSNVHAAQASYANIQNQLDAIGMFLGQITDSTCVSASPSNGTVSVTSYTAVLQQLALLQMDMINISAGILNKQVEVSSTAYHTAQKGLESTHDYVFGSALSHDILQGLQGPK